QNRRILRPTRRGERPEPRGPRSLLISRRRSGLAANRRLTGARVAELHAAGQVAAITTQGDLALTDSAGPAGGAGRAGRTWSRPPGGRQTSVVADLAALDDAVPTAWAGNASEALTRRDLPAHR